MSNGSYFGIANPGGQRGILLIMKTRWRLSPVILGAVLVCGPALAVSQPTTPRQDDSAKQDVKDAGHAPKDATKDTAHDVKKGTTKAYQATKHGTKKVWHKTKDTTEGAVHGAKEGARDGSKDDAKKPE